MNRKQFVAYRRRVLWTLAWSTLCMPVGFVLLLVLPMPYRLLSVGLAYYGLLRATFVMMDVSMKLGTLALKRIG